MGLTDFMGISGLPPEQQNAMMFNMLLGGLSGAMRGSVPSTNPASRSSSNFMGNMLGGIEQGSQQGLGSALALQKAQQEQQQVKAQADFGNMLKEAAKPKTVSVPFDRTTGPGLGIYRPEFLQGTQDVQVPKSGPEIAQAVINSAVQSGNWGALSHPGSAQILKLLSGETAKPFDVSANMKDFLIWSQSKHGFNPQTPEGFGKSLLWAGTPEGQQALKDYAGSKEAYKAPKPLGRGGFSGRLIMEDPHTAELYYADTVGGQRQLASPQDTAQMRPLTIRGLDANTSTELSNFKNSYERLSNIEQKLSDPKMASKVGPLAGRWEKLKLKFANDGATQSVVNELNSMITMAYGLSGKQISYQEMELLKQAMLPQLEQPDSNLFSTIDFAKRWVANTHNDRLQYVRDSMFDTNIKPIEYKPFLRPKTPGVVGGNMVPAGKSGFTIERID